MNNPEVRNIFRLLKNRKAARLGGIQLQLVKYSTEKLYQKSHHQTNCDNYRGIAVIGTVARIYGKLLKKG